jgi:solute carrier family 26 (sodium-independent sulfate anion transporter), member 11
MYANDVLSHCTEESVTYPNAGRVADKIIEAAKSVTRRAVVKVILKKGDRAWNDPGDELEKSNLPILRAVVVDFSAVNDFDSTGLQVNCFVRLLRLCLKSKT